MKIKVIDYNFKRLPFRAHDNDAGADVYARCDYVLKPGETVNLNLGFGLEIPDGYMGLIFPRSSLAAKGICCQLPPIDSGYRGPVHAIVTNYSTENYEIHDEDRVGQLVVLPIAICDFVFETDKDKRGTGAFGSTGT